LRSACASTTGVTGRLAAFAPHAKIIHVDIDPAEIGKNRTPDIPIVGDVKRVLEKLNARCGNEATRGERNEAARRGWRTQIREWKEQYPLVPSTSDTEIKPQHLMARSTASPAARQSWLPTSASTRCGRRSLSASTSRACGSNSGGQGPRRGMVGVSEDRLPRANREERAIRLPA